MRRNRIFWFCLIVDHGICINQRIFWSSRIKCTFFYNLTKNHVNPFNDVLTFTHWQIIVTAKPVYSLHRTHPVSLKRGDYPSFPSARVLQSTMLYGSRGYWFHIVKICTNLYFRSQSMNENLFLKLWNPSGFNKRKTPVFSLEFFSVYFCKTKLWAHNLKFGAQNESCTTLINVLTFESWKSVPGLRLGIFRRKWDVWTPCHTLFSFNHLIDFK